MAITVRNFEIRSNKQPKEKGQSMKWKITLSLLAILVQSQNVTLDRAINSAVVLNGSSAVQRHELVCNSGIDRLPKLPGIYRIFHIPTNREYIGSSKNVRHRRNRHFMALRHGTHCNRHLQCAYNKYGKDEFECQLIELCPLEKLIEREQFHMDQRKPVFNARLTAESSPGWHHSEEAKRKIGSASKMMKRDPEMFKRIVATRKANGGYSMTPEHKEKLRQSAIGRPMPKWLKAKISATWKGKQQPPEMIEKRAVALRGRKLSPEHIAKMRAANLGKVHSLESRLKRSISLRGIERTSEWRARLSSSQIGKVVSEETRRKISETLKGRRPTDAIRAKLREKTQTRQRENGRFI